MKTKAILLTILLLVALSIGCAPAEPNEPAEPDDTQGETTPPETTPDVVTTASIVDNEADFEKAIGPNGTWIICTLNDLTFDKELVLEGEYTNGKKDDEGQDIIQRKIALYTQDEDRNVTQRFTLTAPKLTINSPNARIQSGTFIGDLYVMVDNFELRDAIIDGNVVFATDTAKSTFIMDEASDITGDQSVEE